MVRCVRLVAAVACVPALSVLIVRAQTTTTLRVLRAAVVLNTPAESSEAVGHVVSGELLELLDERESWYLVRPFDDGDTGAWRTGWVEAVVAEPLDVAPALRRILPRQP